MLCPQNCVQKDLSKKYSIQKRIKKVWSKNIFSNKNLCQKIFGSRKICGPKKFLKLKNLGPENVRGGAENYGVLTTSVMGFYSNEIDLLFLLK